MTEPGIKCIILFSSTILLLLALGFNASSSKLDKATIPLQKIKFDNKSLGYLYSGTSWSMSGGRNKRRTCQSSWTFTCTRTSCRLLWCWAHSQSSSIWFGNLQRRWDRCASSFLARLSATIRWWPLGYRDLAMLKRRRGAVHQLRWCALSANDPPDPNTKSVILGI